MSYDTKIGMAKDAVIGHFTAIEADDPGAKWDAIFNQLKALGGTNEANLAACSYEDLQGCGMPKLIAKEVAGYFRVKKEVKRVLTEARVKSLSLPELVGVYDPKQPHQFVMDQLAKICKGHPFLVFERDKTLNIEATVAVLEEIHSGMPPRSTYPLESGTVSILKLGERPEMVAEENPLYPDRPLRKGGVCDQINRSWNGVPKEVRQLIFLARNVTLEIPNNTFDTMRANQIMDLVIREGAVAQVRSLFPKAAQAYDERAEMDSLPGLMVRLNSNGVNGGSNNPFSIGANRTY